MIKTLTKNPGMRMLTLMIALAGGLVFSAIARADEDEAPLNIPDTPAAIWQVIDQETQEMADLIQAGTLDDLHHHAFAVRDLVTALPEHSASLSADALAQVEANGKFIATLASRLDEAGDSGDKAASESNFEKLKTVLASIRTNYPDIPAASANDLSKDIQAGSENDGETIRDRSDESEHENHSHR